jgi:hypothetical protein
MPKTLFKAPNNIVKEWPEIFEDMWISTMPVIYLHTLQIEFNNGRIWEFELKENISDSDSTMLSNKLKDLLSEYYTSISRIHFELDIDRLKVDFSTIQNKFFL